MFDQLEHSRRPHFQQRYHDLTMYFVAFLALWRRISVFSSANSVCVGTNHSQSFQSHCLSIRWLGIVTDTKMQSSQFRKEISSQFLLKFDHDSSQHSGTGKAFRPAPHTSKPSRSSRVVNQSIWNDFTAGNCSETILTSARKKILAFCGFLLVRLTRCRG